MTLAEKALEIALSQVGVQEVPRGSNRGPQVDEYVRSVGLDPAGKYAWCVALMYWCFKQAAEAMGRPNPLPRTGGVHDMFNKAKGKYQVRMAMPGDLVFMDFGNGKGHVYMVERVSKAGNHSVEGNTNDDGSREGYEVCKRIRPMTGRILGILRFP